MADRPICIGVKTDGVRCDNHAVVGEQRCRTHLNTVRNHGPNTTAIKELGYTHKRLLRQLAVHWDQRIDAEQNLDRRAQLAEDAEHEIRITRLNQRREIDVLRRTQQDQIRQTGIDPDADANRRRLIEEQRRRVDHQRRMEEFHRRLDDNRRAQAAVAAVNALREVLDDDAERPRVRQAVRPADRELERFVQDNQNIHTVRTVNMTKEMVAIILTIPVPEEYKWNSRECSKTPGDIMMTCRLSPKAAWQMAAKYCQDESIYDLGKGIYGKVLDGVWQFILKSSDKPDLCRVLKQEMEDNIGMCAQGNLSRLCNILAGYMEGIGSQESIADILGRLMPKLMEIEDISTRLREAHRILKENHVPVPEWKSWVDPLMFDQDVEMTVGFIRNDQDEVVGFVAVEV